MIQVRLALEVGFKGSDIFLNGCGKQFWELELAIDNGCFLNVDSSFDAENICRVADLRQKIVQVNITAYSDFSKKRVLDEYVGQKTYLTSSQKPGACPSQSASASLRSPLSCHWGRGEQVWGEQTYEQT